jgi:hypothetical protein
MNSTVKTAAKSVEELNKSDENSDTEKEGVQHTKARLGVTLKQKWESTIMHSQYTKSTDTHLVSEEDTFLWLSRGYLKAETESEIIAAQDQTFQSKILCNYNITNTNTQQMQKMSTI